MKKASLLVCFSLAALCGFAQSAKQDAQPQAHAQPVAATSNPAPASNPEPAAKPAEASPVVTPTKIVPNSKVYIGPMDGGFDSYLMAAFRKKKVQLLAVADKEQADYVITGTSVDKKAGWAKIVFMGNVHSDNAASITLADRKSGVILYAYAVDKKSTMHGQQTTAEACAKHLQAHIEGRE